MDPTWTAELVALDSLTPHPRNYRSHPPDQLLHIKESIEVNGFYRNIVVARDGTILAGHGVTEASVALGLTEVPVVRLPIAPDSPQALRILAGDNLIGQLAFDDDHQLTDMLKELHQEDLLLGTGFNESQLAALLVVSRPASEIESYDAAAEWVGMPDYEPGSQRPRLVISFQTDEDRSRYAEETGLRIDQRGALKWLTRWPWTDRNDPASLRFVDGEAEDQDDDDDCDEDEEGTS